MQNLDKIMKPKAIAVVGASTKEHTIGSDIMKRLQEYEFKGNIYPVNPKGGIIEGKVVSVEELITLAKLPSRETLIAQLAGALLGNITKLAVALNEVSKQKEAANA